MEKKKERKNKIWNDAEKIQHFIMTINKSVEIIDRQLLKISKCAKGRTYLYTPEQVQKLTDYLAEQIVKTNQRLSRKVEPKTSFNVGNSSLLFRLNNKFV